MFVNLLAAAATMDGPLPKCPPHDQAGMVVEVRGRTPQNRNAPYLSRQNRTGSPTDSQLLCPGDIVVNPAGSGIIIRYKLSGQAVATLLPGGSNVTVPKNGFQTQLAMLSERAIGIFDYMATRASGVRGGDDIRKMGLYPLVGQISAVPSWGPLIFAWEGASKGTVTIRQGGQTVTLTGRSPLAIDLAKDCAITCTLVLNLPDVGPVAETVVTTMTAQQAVAQLAIKQFDGDSPPVAIAAWLGTSPQEPAWRLQQASLLWNAACGFPAFGALTQQAYRLTTEPETCGGGH